jgi:hypothetical protein
VNTDSAKPSIDIPHTLTVEQRKQRAATMPETQYERVQGRIRKETKVSHVSSVWVALAFAAFGVGTTILITVESTDNLGAELRGKLEVAGWASLVVIGLCLLAHFMTRSGGASVGDDICDEMDTACGRPRKAREERRWFQKAKAPVSNQKVAS